MQKSAEYYEVSMYISPRAHIKLHYVLGAWKLPLFDVNKLEHYWPIFMFFILYPRHMLHNSNGSYTQFSISRNDTIRHATAQHAAHINCSCLRQERKRYHSTCCNGLTLSTLEDVNLFDAHNMRADDCHSSAKGFLEPSIAGGGCLRR